MKPILFKSTGRRGTSPLTLLFSFALALVPFVASAQIPLYSNSGSVTSPPQVDATSFYNSGVWNISTSETPYETSHTLNYTNENSMTGSVGWEFDYGPLSGGGRGWSANFFNDNNGAITANDGTIGTYLEYIESTPFIITVPGSYLMISATNIINKGSLEAGANGEIVLNGQNVLLNRSALVVSPIAGSGSINTPTNFTPDTAIYDEFWSGGTSNTLTVDDSPWNGTTVYEFSFINVGEPCGVTTATIQIGPLTPQVADSYATNVGLYYLALTNSSLGTNLIPVYSNVVHQAVFVRVNPGANITAQDRFSPMLTPTNFFLPVAVQFTAPFTNFVTLALQTNTLYLVDGLASFTNNKTLLTNLVLNPALPCTDPTMRPSTVIVSRSDPINFVNLFGSGYFASGSPGFGSPSATFFYDPVSESVANGGTAYYSNLVAYGVADVYSAFVDDLAAEPQAGTDLTNAPGRINIYASSLDLTKTRMSALAEIVVQATNLNGSIGADMDCQNLSYNLGSTNGFLNFTNLAGTNVTRFNGTITEWSGLWTNYILTIYTNYITNSTVGGSMPVLFTNATEADFSITVVDASGLKDLTPVTVQDLTLNSTNIVVSDSMYVANSLLLNGLSLTLLGNLTLSGTIEDWSAVNAPILRYFTNNGTLDIPGTANFGDDGATNYAAFVNQGSIFASGQTINSDYLEITNGTGHGTNEAYSGNFLITCKTGLVANANIIAHGDIQFFANSLMIDPSFLSAYNAIDFTVTNSLSDAGVATGNTFSCGNGFNLFIKPVAGDLLGTTIYDTAYGQDEVDHVWAGNDLGDFATGYTNNVAIGTLILHPASLLFEPLFFFKGAGVDNGMYVSNLDLSMLTDYGNELDIDSSLNIYYASASLDGTNGAEQFLNGQQFPSGGHLYWVQGITSLLAGKGNSLTQKLNLTASYNNSAGQFQLLEKILPAQTNITEASTDLVHWVPIYTNIGLYNNFGPTVITDPAATNYPSRFYRFKVLQ